MHCDPTPDRASGHRSRLDRAGEKHERELLEGQLAALEEDIAAGRAAEQRAESVDLFSLPHDAPPDDRRAAVGELVAVTGGHVLIRQVVPTDAELLKRGFEHLSAVSRYRRFLRDVKQLSDADVHFVTAVDHHHHEAVAALDPATGEGAGIARYLRDARDPTLAVATVTVADAWQGRGVGTALVERLARRARAEGIERFAARMIIGDRQALALCEHLGELIETTHVPGGLDVVVRLASHGERPGGFG
jgi:GNAT superfamily N-acetyltransferase